MSGGTVLVTGANGYIGHAVARAFVRAGWRTHGLVRNPAHVADLARNEIRPLIGSPDDPTLFDRVDTVFDVVVSNTETWPDSAGHFANVLTMLQTLAARGRRAGLRPLMMFSSGCKDYGHMMLRHGDAGLKPHVEESPLLPPALLAPRCNLGVTLLGGAVNDADVTVLRPTIVYGYRSGHYGGLIALAAGSNGVLELAGHPATIMHSLHIDDCAEAYLALASHARRGEVAGQAFNVSGGAYETAQEIGEALAASYGLELAFRDAHEDLSPGTFPSLANNSQWVSSAKLRLLTGWRDRRAPFAAGIDGYRLAYEAWVQRPAMQA